MIRSLLPLLALATAGLAACSPSGTSPDPTPKDTARTSTHGAHIESRTYSPGRGGVQITAIYFDQHWNLDSLDPAHATFDEWIVLQSDRDVYTRGWMFSAGDRGQMYYLPDTLHRRLAIYTQRSPALDTDTTLGLALEYWLWNDDAPDTAALMDQDDVPIDTLIYTRR